MGRLGLRRGAKAPALPPGASDPRLGRAELRQRRVPDHRHRSDRGQAVPDPLQAAPDPLFRRRRLQPAVACQQPFDRRRQDRHPRHPREHRQELEPRAAAVVGRHRRRLERGAQAGPHRPARQAPGRHPVRGGQHQRRRLGCRPARQDPARAHHRGGQALRHRHRVGAPRAGVRARAVAVDGRSLSRADRCRRDAGGRPPRTRRAGRRALQERADLLQPRQLLVCIANPAPPREGRAPVLDHRPGDVPQGHTRPRRDHPALCQQQRQVDPRGHDPAAAPRRAAAPGRPVRAVCPR